MERKFFKKSMCSITLLLIMIIGTGCMIFGKGGKSTSGQMDQKEVASTETATEENEYNGLSKKQWEKGYELPVSEAEKLEAQKDCKEQMEALKDLYVGFLSDSQSEQSDDADDPSKKIEKNNTNNSTETSEDNLQQLDLSKEQVQKMMDKLGNNGLCVTTNIYDCDFSSYETMVSFLNASKQGTAGSQVVYEIHSGGGIARKKFIFDGRDMYELYTNCSFNDEKEPIIGDTTYTRIKTWDYTKKGWFCYELCVPEPPEVSEVVASDDLMKITPVKKEWKYITEKYLKVLGYKGNNLFQINWDETHVSKLDYNGLFPYFYKMRHGVKPDSKDYKDGVPEEEFEELLMSYLPVSRSQIRKYASYDKKKQTYTLAALSCGNYSPDDFGTCIPEITDIKNKKDGTSVITIDAVCEMAGTDRLITHKLTVKMKGKNGKNGIKFLSNAINKEDLNNIPPYRYS